MENRFCGSVGKGRKEEGVEKKEVLAFLLILAKVEEILDSKCFGKLSNDRPRI